MLSKFLVLALGAVSSVSATVHCRAACNADNCLRALRASQTPTRLSQASADCTRIIDVTYTPPTVTKTEYTTITETSTLQIPDTIVQSFYDTQTDVIEATATTDQLVTTTRQLVKRIATSSSISFPSYATPCSGFYRFSSACSCIGVTPRIHTASTPSTTITLPVTETSLTSVTNVVDTTSVTITDATVVVTTTATTVTNTIVTTVDPPPPAEITEGVAALYISGVTQNTYMGTYSETADALRAGLTTDKGGAIELRIDAATGYLMSGDKAATGHADVNSSGLITALVFYKPSDFSSTIRPYVCSTDPSGFLNCIMGNPATAVPLVFVFRPSRIWVTTPQYMLNKETDNNRIIQLKLLPQ
ncbi:hypothetical protein TWF730_010184 [Orbilia blumenaviensis]|uniref:Uncharacterized protein n=1 Tax=Orbilia blumenaviensis TaxID=1796055 RepID=A0AAV9UMZ7_9PEZI